MNKVTVSPDWSESEFRTLDLNDKRLEDRLKRIARELTAAPEAPINQASEDWAATKAAYRFFQNTRATCEAILSPHSKRTVERMQGEAVVLAIQDTSYLNFSNPTKTSGLGPIGDRKSNSQGLVVHSTLAVTPAGLPLGLLGQKIWAREGYNRQPERKRKNTSIEHKESYRWIEGLQRVQEATPQHRRVVTICDRESDIYEFFVAAQRYAREFVIRASWDRHLEESEFPRLWEQMAACTVAGCYEVRLPRSEDKAERTANLEVRFARVTLGPTQRHRSSLFYPLPPVPLCAVYVTEVGAPADEDAIEWMLLTNIAVTSFEEAMEKVEWYQCRWQIEVYHRILKSGCRVERCRLQVADRLCRYITLMSIVAWRLFWMTHLKRTNPEAPATTILTENELDTLSALERKQLARPVRPFSVAQAVMAIAKLGGFLARKHDGEPGPTVLWRGWTVLQDATLLGNLVFR